MSRTLPSLLRRGDVTNVTPSEIDRVSALVDTKRVPCETRGQAGRQQESMDTQELLNQIGMWNVFAISGGRKSVIRNEDGEVTDLILPVAHGYRVRINLAVNDTYTVRREFVRGGKVYEKGRVEDVWCDEVGEVAYRASCYVNVAFGEAA